MAWAQARFIRFDMGSGHVHKWVHARVISYISAMVMRYS